MDKLLVKTPELKPEYQKRNRLWEKFYKRLCLWYSQIWKAHPLVHYPLTIDIAVGGMKYQYFRFGLSAVLNRIKHYNIVISSRLEGRNVDVDHEDFHVQTLLTDEQAVEDQLNKELKDLCLN